VSRGDGAFESSNAVQFLVNV